MKLRYKLAILVAALVGWAGYAVSQSGLISTTLTGNETWQIAIGGPGGPGIFTNAAQMRNTTGYAYVTAINGTVNANTLANRYIFVSALTGNVTLNTPTSPYDGEMIEVVNGTASNFASNIVLTASAGQTVNSGTATNLATAASQEYQYVATTVSNIVVNTWFRLR